MKIPGFSPGLTSRSIDVRPRPGYSRFAMEPVDPAERFQDAVVSEICYALGAARRGRLHRILSPLVRLPVRRFARLAAKADLAAGRGGLAAGAAAILADLGLDPGFRGADRIPAGGPLLIAANHPGGFDSIAVLSRIPRPDVKVVLSDGPLFRTFSMASAWFIYAPLNAFGGARALRGGIEHLAAGGALLIFAGGDVEPAPESDPDAGRTFSAWSRSLEVMLRRVPAARLQPAIISGIIGPKALRNPLVRIRREETRRQKLAETIHILGRMRSRRAAPLRPHISFGDPVPAAGLLAAGAMPAVASLARGLLDDHLSWLKAGPAGT